MKLLQQNAKIIYKNCTFEITETDETNYTINQNLNTGNIQNCYVYYVGYSGFKADKSGGYVAKNGIIITDENVL